MLGPRAATWSIFHLEYLTWSILSRAGMKPSVATSSSWFPGQGPWQSSMRQVTLKQRSSTSDSSMTSNELEVSARRESI